MFLLESRMHRCIFITFMSVFFMYKTADAYDKSHFRRIEITTAHAEQAQVTTSPPDVVTIVLPHTPFGQVAAIMNRYKGDNFFSSITCMPTGDGEGVIVTLTVKDGASGVVAQRFAHSKSKQLVVTLLTNSVLWSNPPAGVLYSGASLYRA